MMRNQDLQLRLLWPDRVGMQMYSMMRALVPTSACAELFNSTKESHQTLRLAHGLWDGQHSDRVIRDLKIVPVLPLKTC